VGVDPAIIGFGVIHSIIHNLSHILASHQQNNSNIDKEKSFMTYRKPFVM